MISHFTSIHNTLAITFIKLVVLSRDFAFTGELVWKIMYLLLHLVGTMFLEICM